MNVINPRSEIDRKGQYQPTLVQRGATLGANSTIGCGLTIGQYALVAAGAVVTEDVPAFPLVAGVPARPIGHICRCGVSQLHDHLHREEKKVAGPVSDPASGRSPH